MGSEEREVVEDSDDVDSDNVADAVADEAPGREEDGVAGEYAGADDAGSSAAAAGTEV